MTHITRTPVYLLVLLLVLVCSPGAATTWVTFYAEYDTPFPDCMFNVHRLNPINQPVGSYYVVELSYNGSGLPPWTGCSGEQPRPLNGDYAVWVTLPGLTPFLDYYHTPSWSYFFAIPGDPGSTIKGLSLDWGVMVVDVGLDRYRFEFWGGITEQPFHPTETSQALWKYAFSTSQDRFTYNAPKAGLQRPWLEVVLGDLEEASDSSEYPWDLRAPLEALSEASIFVEELMVTAGTEQLRDSILALLAEVETRLNLAADRLEAVPPDASAEEWEAARAAALVELQETWAAHRRARSRLAELEAQLLAAD